MSEPKLPTLSETAGVSAIDSALSAIAPLEKHLEMLQREINDLQFEIQALRGRDETIKFQMNRVDEEMRLAARLQQDFLPKRLPDIGRVSFKTLFRPAGYVSGDLYDVMRLDEKRVAFYMADAVGHGMPAALLTMFIKNALVTKKITPDGYQLLAPSQTMARLNDVLFDQHLSNATFATAIYGTIDIESLECNFSKGGHPSPVLLRANGVVETLDSDGSLLGIFNDEVFAERKVQLSAGDRLFVFSDGVEVSFGLPGGQGVDPEKWKSQLLERRGMTTTELLADLEGLMDDQIGSLAPHDDLTIIVADIH